LQNLIEQAIAELDESARLLTVIRGGKLPASILGVTQSAKPHLLHVLARETGRRVVLVSATSEEAARNARDGAFFPARDIELRAVSARSRESAFARIEVLFSQSADVVYMPVLALQQKMMPPKAVFGRPVRLKPGGRYPVGPLLDTLLQMGFERVETVYEKGQFARRGEIVDVFSPCYTSPIRLTFFDDEIETIRHFNENTQKSKGKSLAKTTLYPAGEFMLEEDMSDKALSYLRGFEDDPGPLGTAAKEMSFQLKEFGTFENADSFLPVMVKTASADDYFEDAIFIFDDFDRIRIQAKKNLDELGVLYDSLKKNGEVFPVQKDSLFDFRATEARLRDRLLEIAPVARAKWHTEPVDFKMRQAAQFAGKMDLLAESLKERNRAGYRVALFAGGKAEALSRALSDFDLLAPVLERGEGVFVTQEVLGYGFEIPQSKTYFLGEWDIWGKIRKKSVRPPRSQKTAEELFAELSPGDYVVHEVHGRGRYLGLKKMEAAGSVAEYMEIEYKDGDKLYVPTAQIERVQKYIGSEDGRPALSRLGGREWENTKNKVRESVAALAFDLVELYASRFEARGFKFDPDTVWQRQFEDNFEFEETEGQEKSLTEIKKDMESRRVMDRLLLGDVGYGKTEVAMRACFKAVMNGKQAAVLVPTTLLARQHLATFKKRFEGFPVVIEMLSRFSASRHKDILRGLSSGQTDIIIGTHKLLSKNVHFHDLGLLIVDEEQRFGVAHKEKIKLLKKSVDVLTLSATPIPRTLEMSLIGIRDMSTIKTPPVSRKQTESYVLRYSDGLVRDAVLYEIKRGGQVYFVCRQINQMERLLLDVKKNVPEARVASVHGQMSESQIEKTVSAFIDGRTDVLVCTTIIESGIDIPAVNTIIIYEADKFGLSQLYQLKGRVGRGDRVSHAYFTYLGGIMGENAKKRMQAIREFTQLGSGFKIAMRDLQIRGAGNLLGAEQSGHMSSVGYSLYCKMMRQAIDAVKGKKVPVEEEFETAVDLSLPAYIPDTYIGEETHKLDMYKAISRVGSPKDVKEVRLELTDRYGKPPREVENLIISAMVKKVAHDAGVASVIRKSDKIELKYGENVNIDPGRLIRFLTKMGEKALFKATNPPVIVFGSVSVRELVEFLRSLKRCKSSVLGV
jgi:transcription-repair coupling factor (superfamily II helicase)